MGLRVAQLGLLVARRDTTPVFVAASSSIIFSTSFPVDPEVDQHYFYVQASSTFRVYADFAQFPDITHVFQAQAFTPIDVSATASMFKIAVARAWSQVDFYPNATGGRDIYASAVTSMGLAGGTGPSEGILESDGASLVNLFGQADLTMGKFGTSNMIQFITKADVDIELTGGLLEPGGDSAEGPRIVLLEGISGQYPVSFAETSRGVLILANGINPMLRWDGLAASIELAGLAAPGTAVQVSGSGAGVITGRRWVYSRFVDTYGNKSNLSPVCGPVDFGQDAGVATVLYDNVPVPTDPKVARRQILRNLEGDASVFYVDIDTNDLVSTSFSSVRLDADLSAQEPVAFRFEDDTQAANRFGVPPSHKAVVCYHLGRVFAAVDSPYSFGHIEVAFGNRLVRGVGTRWTPSMVGRSLYCESARTPQVISDVMPDEQYLALQEPFSGSTGRYVRYSVRPSDQERRLVYYSEADSPEAWPAWNAFAVPEHSDDITGLLVMRSYLYIIEKRNISSFTFKADPGRDGFVFLKSNRGCVNNRCHVTVEDVVYMLDEAGVHRFDGESSTHLSAKINNIFNDPTYPYRLDWSADRTLWHAVQDPIFETVRWFVDFVGKEKLTHALCYDYRRDRWWLESYPEAVAASCVTTIGYRRIIAGTTARRVLALGEGTLDGIDANAYGSFAGTIVSATNTTLTVAQTPSGLPSGLAGVPVAITSGAGKGQLGIVSEVIGGNTISFWHLWPIVPAPGDTYAIGGVPWDWRGGWLPYLDQETDNARDISVVFKPTTFQGSIDVRCYFDYDDNPRPWGLTREVDGISTITGNPDINIRTDKVRGYAIQRMQSRRERYSLSDYFLQIEVGGTQGVEPTRIFEIIVDGVFHEGSDRT